MMVRPKLGRPEFDSSERNSLLLALAPADHARLMEYATNVPLKLRHDVIEPGEPIRYVWFPQQGMLSIVNDMEDGKTTIEIGVIGREGMAGLPLLFGRTTQPFRVLVQVAGEATRIPAEAFQHMLEEVPSLKKVLHRFTLSLMNQTGQQVACNRLHSLEQRCAKWLLTTHDHMDTQELPLTQELLAIMLGVRRPGVTVAAQTLQDAGLITYRRGRISITDRVGLEHVACECYRRIRNQYEALLSEYSILPAVAPRVRIAQPV